MKGSTLRFGFAFVSLLCSFATGCGPTASADEDAGSAAGSESEGGSVQEEGSGATESSTSGATTTTGGYEEIETRWELALGEGETFDALAEDDRVILLARYGSGGASTTMLHAYDLDGQLLHERALDYADYSLGDADFRQLRPTPRAATFSRAAPQAGPRRLPC